jgi:hypothetical protein
MAVVLLLLVAILVDMAVEVVEATAATKAAAGQQP